jgi:hypothetical protein
MKSELQVNDHIFEDFEKEMHARKHGKYQQLYKTGLDGIPFSVNLAIFFRFPLNKYLKNFRFP